MITFKQFLLNEMSSGELSRARQEIEKWFADLSVYVQFTVHFKDRVNDETGRERTVEPSELVAAFAKMRQKYGMLLQQAQDNHQELTGIIKDIEQKLNIPFVIHFEANGPHVNKYPLRAITIMRKDPSKFAANSAGGVEMRV